MALGNLDYVDDRRKSDGVQPDGMGWLATCTQHFAGYLAGDIAFDYVYEVYAGAASWGDGSGPMAKGSRRMAPWRLRNAIRSVKDEFLAVNAALQTAAAEELGGVYVPDPEPPWLDAAMESEPEPEVED